MTVVEDDLCIMDDLKERRKSTLPQIQTITFAWGVLNRGTKVRLRAKDKITEKESLLTTVTSLVKVQYCHKVVTHTYWYVDTSKNYLCKNVIMKHVESAA